MVEERKGKGGGPGRGGTLGNIKTASPACRQPEANNTETPRSSCCCTAQPPPLPIQSRNAHSHAQPAEQSTDFTAAAAYPRRRRLEGRRERASHPIRP